MPSIRLTYHLDQTVPDAQATLRNAGKTWLREARGDVARKTGRLRNSLYYRVIRLVRRWKLEVGTKGVPYAIYQEDIQPFAEQNFEDVTRELGGARLPPTQKQIRDALIRLAKAERRAKNPILKNMLKRELRETREERAHEL